MPVGVAREYRLSISTLLQLDQTLLTARSSPQALGIDESPIFKRRNGRRSKSADQS